MALITSNGHFIQQRNDIINSNYGLYVATAEIKM